MITEGYLVIYIMILYIFEIKKHKKNGALMAI
jgi:hypothetical protein